MRIVVIIPTYNEKDNIIKLLNILYEEFEALPNDEMHVVVVDGNSPDGTAEIVKNMAWEKNNLHLLMEKEKGGLGAAYLYGMKYAIKELSADALCEMDADLQHDPKDLKNFVKELHNGADYVIGSRYIKGGSVPKSWAFHRKFISFFGSFFARIVLWMPEVHDVTSGYRLSRVNILKKIDLDKLERKAYTYKIHLLYEMKEKGAKIVEVPIAFGLRDRGDSKMEKENFVESFKLVLRLRFHKNESFFKFLIVGLAGLFVQTTILFFLSLVTKLDPKIALLPSFIAAVVTTFSLNNAWSFKKNKIVGSTLKLKKFLFFVVINIGSFFIQRSTILLFQTLSHNSLSVVLLVGYPIGIGFGLVWNYLFYSRMVWRQTKG